MQIYRKQHCKSNLIKNFAASYVTKLLLLGHINKTFYLNHFETIYTENYRLIFNVVQKIIGNTDEASDIVKETFIALYQLLQKNIQVDYPRSWLYKVAVNRSIDYPKKQNQSC